MVDRAVYAVSQMARLILSFTDSETFIDGLSIVVDYSGKLEDEQLSTEKPSFLDTKVPFIPYFLNDQNRHAFPASKEAYGQSGYNAV